MATAQTVNYSGKDKETGQEYSGSFTLQVPESVDEGIQMWGEDVILSKAVSAVQIDAQRIARPFQDDSEGAQNAINEWTPGVSRTRAGGPSKKAIVDAMKKLDPERLSALLEELGVAA